MNRKPPRVTLLLFALLTIPLALCLPGQAQASTPALASTPTPGNVSAGESLYAQGEGLYEQQEYEQALAQFQQAAAGFRRVGDREGEADALMKTGMCYKELGRHDSAYDAYQQELEIRREIGDLDGEGMVYLNIGSNSYSAGDDQRTVEFAQKAIPILEKTGNQEGVVRGYVQLSVGFNALEDYPSAVEAAQAGLPLAEALGDLRSEAVFWGELAVSFRYLDQYEKSMPAHDRALEIWRELGDLAEEAWELDSQAMTYSHFRLPLLAAEASAAAARIEGELGNLQEQASDELYAAGLYFDGHRCEKAIEIIKLWIEGDFADDDLEFKAAAFEELGTCYLAIGDYDKGLAALQASLDISRQLGFLWGEATALHNLGKLSGDLGDYAAALESLNQALRLEQELGNREMEARTLRAIGVAYADMGELDREWYYFEQSLNLQREIGDRRGEVDTLVSMAGLQRQLGNAEEATRLLNLAIETSNSLVYIPGMVGAARSLGMNDWKLGDHEAAIEHLNSALEANELTGDRLRGGWILLDLGLNYELLGDVRQATLSYNKALQIAQDLGHDEGLQANALLGLGALQTGAGEYEVALATYQEALQAFRERNDRESEASTLSHIGALYEEQGMDERALQYYLDSVKLREAMRESVQLEGFRRAVASSSMHIYQRAIRILVELGRHEEAFDLTERGRSRSFLDRMGNGLPALSEAADADLLERERRLRKEIAALEDDLVNGSPMGSGELRGSTLEAFRANLAARRQEYVDLLGEIQLTSPEVTSLTTVTTTDLASIQEALGPETTLVSYYIVDGSIIAFVVTRDSLNVVRSAGSPDTYLQALKDFYTLGMSNLRSAHPASLAALYEGLITPILPYLNTEGVVIIPHQWLWDVPFAALSDGENYLGEQFVLYTLPSASTLQFLEPAAGDGLASPLVLGDAATDNPELPPLPFAAEEAKRVANLLGVKPLLGAEASESALRSHAGNASILHLATHGSFDAEAPLFSRIWLAPDDESDGRLNVYEVYGLDLSQTELVVLSGCQTNMGDLSAGDDLVGLNRAFLYGAPTVVASLWSVDDEATAFLMEDFYANLQEGMGKAEALQAAQEIVRTDQSHPVWAHPYYWAGFVLSGDPGEVAALHKEAAEGTPPRVWILILVGAMLAGGLGYLGYVVLRRNRMRGLAEHENVKHHSSGP